MNQHESDTNQHKSTRVRNELTQVNKSKKVKKSPRRVNASQQKSNSNMTIYKKLQKYLMQSFYLWFFFSGTMSALYLTAKVS